MSDIRQPEMRYIEDDALTPLRIEHLCEEIYADDVLEQKYNYLVYHFEREGAYIRARAYLDEVDEVAIYGPYESELMESAPVEDAEFFGLVLDYLKRRYVEVKTLSKDDALGYRTIWRAPDDAQR